MDTSRNSEIMNMRGFGLSHERIEKLLIQNEATYFHGAFKQICYKFSIKVANKSLKYVCPIFGLNGYLVVGRLRSMAERLHDCQFHESMFLIA